MSRGYSEGEHEGVWGPDVLDMPVLRYVDRQSPSLGVLFTDTFMQFAKNNGISLVTFQFPKGKPEEALPDSANCTNKEYQDLLTSLKGEK